MGFCEVALVVQLAACESLVRVALYLLVEVAHALGAIEDRLADAALRVRIYGNLELMAAYLAHSVQRLVPYDRRA